MSLHQLDISKKPTEILKLWSESDYFCIVNKPKIKLTESLLNYISSQYNPGFNKPLRFDVSVNESKITSIAIFMLKINKYDVRTYYSICYFIIGLYLYNFTSFVLFLAIKCKFIRYYPAMRILKLISKLYTKAYSLIIKPSVVIDNIVNSSILTDNFKSIDELSFPGTIHIALTKSCNLKCVMCPYHSEEVKELHTTSYFEKPLKFDQKLLYSIINESAHYNSQLVFGQYDEPFLYRDFANMARMAKIKGCKVNITTNGTLLNNDDSLILIKAGIDNISFSLDAASQETYERVRGGDFSIPLNNLRELVNTRNRLRGRTKIRACMVLQDINKHEYNLFYDLMQSTGVDMISFYNITVLSANGVWFNPVLNIDVDNMPQHRSVCSQLYDQLVVYPDGNVALCCLTTMYMGTRNDIPYVGNIADDTISDIWSSNVYKKIRSEAFDGKYNNSVCRDCTIWYNFKGIKTLTSKNHEIHKNPYESTIYF